MYNIPLLCVCVCVMCVCGWVLPIGKGTWCVANTVYNITLLCVSVCVAYKQKVCVVWQILYTVFCHCVAVYGIQYVVCAKTVCGVCQILYTITVCVCVCVAYRQKVCGGEGARQVFCIYYRGAVCVFVTYMHRVHGVWQIPYAIYRYCVCVAYKQRVCVVWQILYTIYHHCVLVFPTDNG